MRFEAASREAAASAAVREDPAYLAVGQRQRFRQLVAGKTGPELRAAVASAVPAGDVYSYTALLAEQQQQSQALWEQLLRLAQSQGRLFDRRPQGASSSTLTLRAQRLGEALLAAEESALREAAAAEAKRLHAAACEASRGIWRPGHTPVDEPPDIEPFAAGLRPLAALLEATLEEHGGYRDIAGRMSEGRRGDARSLTYIKALALCTFMVQAFVPLLTVAAWWPVAADRGGYAVELMLSRFCFLEPICFPDAAALMRAVLVVLGVTFAVQLLMGHLEAELARAAFHAAFLPLSSPWCLLGPLAAAVNCLLLPVIVLLLGWSGDKLLCSHGLTASVVMAFSALKLHSWIGLEAFLGISAAGFRRLVLSSYAAWWLCPVDLTQLVDSEAVSVGRLWRLSYDAAGRPWSFRTKRPCTTRLRLCKVDGARGRCASGDDALQGAAMLYQVSPELEPLALPGGALLYCRNVLVVLRALLTVAQFALPIFYVLMLDLPCHPPGGVHKHVLQGAT
eukprot:TRINITY_DN121098_c0_g1_i1.p1 TRINITY_DN121098_c0_g1~~TRINITY_DN121098_c0_g1_i1.p1  ORF type:complete len:508 (-),score=116.21 TRINITY_DN121098_c0_g1_i1:23-1546(-)